MERQRDTRVDNGKQGIECEQVYAKDRGEIMRVERRRIDGRKVECRKEAMLQLRRVENRVLNKLLLSYNYDSFKYQATIIEKEKRCSVCFDSFCYCFIPTIYRFVEL